MGISTGASQQTHKAN